MAIASIRVAVFGGRQSPASVGRADGRTGGRLGAWLVSLALSGVAAATTDECNQDPVFPTQPTALGYAAGDCSLDGNGSLAIIGEFGGADLDPLSPLVSVGRALIYHYANGEWTEVQRIQHNEPESSDLFGTSVAVSGRFAIIAAAGRGLDDMGAIYFFERDVIESPGNQWSQFGGPILNPSGEEDRFGGSIQQHETVAIDGSIAVVSASEAVNEHGGSSTASGRVYVYVFDVVSGEWVHEATLKPPSPDDTQACGFGYSVEISGDRVIVGAPYWSTSQHSHAGKAYVFTRTGTGSTAWTLEGELVSDSPGEDHRLGWSVSIDGNATLVGAPGASQATVFTYSTSTNVWSQSAELEPSVSALGFGYSVALSSTLALVGAPFKAIGSAFLFQRTIGSWSEVLILGSTVTEPLFIPQVGETLALRGRTGIVGALGTPLDDLPKVGAVLFFTDLLDPDCE